MERVESFLKHVHWVGVRSSVELDVQVALDLLVVTELVMEEEVEDGDVAITSEQVWLPNVNIAHVGEMEGG